MKQENPQHLEPEAFKEWNERMVRKYDPEAFHHHSNPLIRWIEGKRVRTIFRMADIEGKDRVLEIGCGAGNVIEQSPGGILFGVDLSTFILRKAKRNLDQRAHLFQGDAQNLPCGNRLFDYVICSEVLEHIPEPSSALREMARILKPHGVAIISIPNEQWINRIKRILVRFGVFKWFMDRRGAYRDMPERMDDEWHLHSFPLKEWVRFFQQDFRLSNWKGIPFRWFPIRYVVRLDRIE